MTSLWFNFFIFVGIFTLWLSQSGGSFSCVTSTPSFSVVVSDRDRKHASTTCIYFSAVRLAVGVVFSRETTTDSHKKKTKKKKTLSKIKVIHLSSLDASNTLTYVRGLRCSEHLHMCTGVSALLAVVSRLPADFELADSPRADRQRGLYMRGQLTLQTFNLSTLSNSEERLRRRSLIQDEQPPAGHKELQQPKSALSGKTTAQKHHQASQEAGKCDAFE